MEVHILIRLSILGLFYLFGNNIAYDPATCIQCRESHMCKPPECFCCRDKMPLQTHTIPQMVFFTFDDAVNPQVANFYRQLFSPKRTNPNGCPISMTLFVSHRNTVYGLVKEFYEKGMEIASHSVTHSHMNSNTFIREARKQKENLSKRAGIPGDKIVGWRSPFLEPVGDLQPSVLKDLGYEYDATLTMAKKNPNDKAVTPFTLDFGWPYDCKIKPCPTRAHKGFWEVPVVSVKDYLNKYDCVYVDGCNNPPPTENLAYKFLWDNFQKYYTTNRAPMGINMHASWFYYPDRKAAMDKFIKELVKIDDVYIVSVKQVIEWLRNPTSLHQIKTFPPWQCNGNVTSALQSGNMHFDSRSQRQRPREGTYRPKNTRIGTFISNVPKPSFSSRTWQTPRPQRRQPLVPTTRPAPVPPMAPNNPIVRFWWRPPNLVDPTIQMQEQQRQETLRRRRLEEEKLRRLQVEEQARILQQKRQEELRQQELARQVEVLKRQNEMETKRLEDMQLRRRREQELEKQRQLEAEQQRKAKEVRIKELQLKELVKRQELGRKMQSLSQQKKLTGSVNLHENEFLQMSEANNQQTSAPIVQRRDSQSLQDEFLQVSGVNSQQTSAPVVRQQLEQIRDFQLLQNEFLQVSGVNSRQTSAPVVKQPFDQSRGSQLIQDKFLQISGVNSQQASDPVLKQPFVQSRDSQLLQDEFLQISGVNSRHTSAPVVKQPPAQSADSQSLQNEFLQIPKVNSRKTVVEQPLGQSMNSNLLQNEFLQISDVNGQETKAQIFEKPLDQSMNSNLLQNEFLQISDVNGQETKAQIFEKPLHQSINSNLLQNEFLQISDINSPQANAPIVEQIPVQNRGSQNFQDTVKNNNQLQGDLGLHTITPTTSTNTISQQDVLEESFQKFIARKLDEILGFRPSDRTQQLELLSIAELRALQGELRNRLVKGSLSDNQSQGKSPQSVNRQTSSISAMESQPFQNELRPASKPMLNEFHTPNIVEITKLNEFQTKEFVKQETSKNLNDPFIDPILSEPLGPVHETAQFETNGRLSAPLQTTTAEQTTTQTPSTTQAHLITKAQTTTTERPLQKLTTTTATTRTTPTTQPETSTSTTMTRTSTTTTTKPTTTTTQYTTPTTTQYTTPTTTPLPTTTKKVVSTEKLIISVVQRWTPSENINVPWQRWITESPGMTEPQTTTPGAHVTRNPPQKSFFTVKDMKKTKHLFNEQALHPLLTSSDNLNEIAVNQVNESAMQNNVTENKQQPRAFVNAPLHFEINYDINGQNQPGIFAGINFNTNRFKSPVQPSFGSVHVSSKDVLTKTNTTTSASTTKTAEVTAQPLPTYQSISNIVSNESFKIPIEKLHQEQRKIPLRNKVQFIAQDVSNVVDKYIVLGNESETQVPDMTQQVAESVLPPKPLVYVSPIQNAKCIQEVNCIRPDCVCKETSPPNGISLTDTPQIIYITVDGSLNFHTYGKMRSLFSRSRKNPNGCRIKGTVFVTDTGSSYRIANVLRNDGVEVAMMGVSSRPYTDSGKLRKDLMLQRKRISTSAKIALMDVKGWRSPGFSPVGDEQFDILSNQSLYDSSLLLHKSAKDLPIPWPHTLDFGWNESCEMGTCPNKKHSGLWEVPAIPYSGPKNSTACEYIDACTVQPDTKQETLDFLMNNFNAYYKTNRAPFAIRLKQIWFHWYYRENLAGLLMFLDKVLGFGNVYITSVSDTIEWMKSPKPLKDLKQFKQWKC